MLHRLVQGVVQGASYKLQSGWLIHQTLLGQISVLHHLARGPWYKDKVLKTIRAVVDSPSSSRPYFRVASFSAGCVVQDANYKL